MGAESYDIESLYNGVPSATIGIRLAAGANALQTAENIRERMIEMKPFLPTGVDVVYPYDTHTYWLKNKKGEFSINSNLAKIIEFNEDSCKVEIVTGKKGKFVLDCLLEDGTTTSLEIDIKSL